MKAIVQNGYGGPERLELADLPLPEPGRGRVRVRVAACSVNLSDWEGLKGDPAYARISRGLVRPRLIALGSDIVGHVDALGPDVNGWSLGDRVMGDFVMDGGGFAEFALCRASHMVRVPEGMSDEVAAALPQAGGIAVTGTDGLRAGQRLLINGAGGGSGTMALQLAKAAGVHVTAVDNAGKVDWLRELGADAVIDYRARDFADGAEQWDRILDMVATRGAAHVARALAPSGVYRAAGGRVRTLLGMMAGSLFQRRGGRRIGILMVRSGAALTARIAALAAEGRIAPVIEEVLPLDGVADALTRTGAGAVKGKIVIRPAP